MPRYVVLVSAVLLPLTLVHAATYTVTNTNNSGAGSFRGAIAKANTRVGADTITFSAGMMGQEIPVPTTLPALTDAGTTIRGDLNDDSVPDVALRGPGDGNTIDGLKIKADGCVVDGLSIYAFNGTDHKGLILQGASGCTVRSCFLGLNLLGQTIGDATMYCLWLESASGNTIGGSSWPDRNAINITLCAIRLLNSSSNTIIGNHIGVTADGSGPLPLTTWWGVWMGGDGRPCKHNTVGGPGDARNLFAGLDWGVTLQGAATSNNTVKGNYFGLAADGETALDMTYYGVEIKDGAQNNTIGGAGTDRNIFAGGANGAWLLGAGPGNRIRGNYFGTNASGTQARPLAKAIFVTGADSGGEIGGPSWSYCNYIAPTHGGLDTCGIHVKNTSGSILIRRNKIGVLPNGKAVPQELDDAIWFEDSVGQVTCNTVAACTRGLYVGGSLSDVTALHNTFRNCHCGVMTYGDGRVLLGDVVQNQKGYNRFRTCTTFIWNNTPLLVMAEWNDFGTTSQAQIAARIYDGNDDPSKGLVDFDPLQGGASPSGVFGPLAVMAPTAVPTARGAEIAFSLSAPAAVTVQVLNVAGRPVAAVLRDAPLGSGLQRVPWSLRTDAGSLAPAGQYLIRISARSTDGGEVRAITTVRVER
jgi:hypothetical protein